MIRTLPLLAACALLGCAPVLRMPGPPVVVGSKPPKAPPLPDAPHVPADAATPISSNSASVVEEIAQPAPARQGKRQARLGEAIADSAKHYLRHPTNGYRNDCSGFVMAATARAGAPLSGNTASLWDSLKADGRVHYRRTPKVGDLAFFDNTTDRNRNGRVDDPLTHIAVVIHVEQDGTILLAHDGTGAGRSELIMNLNHPDVHISDRGKVLNNHLRGRKASDSKKTRYLAGELWRGFATVSPRTEVAEL